MKKELLQLWNLSTINQYQERVKNMNLLVRKGECCLLCGKDYTGRILSNIFKGEGKITEGSILVKNEPIEECNRDVFEHKKIFYVDGDTGFMDSLNLAENLFILKKNNLRKIFINEKAIHIQAETLLKSYGLYNFNAESKMNSLSAADKISLTIVKLIGQGAEMLVLNNISSEYSEKDIASLMKLLVKLKEKEVTLLIYDSCPELFYELTDSIILTNQGKIVKKLLDREEFFEYEKWLRQKEREQAGVEILQTENENTLRETGFEKIRIRGKEPFSIMVKEGEIVYITDLDTMEQAELWDSLLGKAFYKPVVRLDGKTIEYKDVSRLVKHRIGFWGGHKECVEILRNLSIKDNILLPSLKRISRFGSYQTGAEYILGDNFIIEEGFLALTSQGTEDGNYSENDILKTVLYKWKLFHPRVLILNNIISRTDADLKEWLKCQLTEMAGRGTAIILLETTRREALELAHRILQI